MEREKEDKWGPPERPARGETKDQRPAAKESPCKSTLMVPTPHLSHKHKHIHASFASSVVRDC